MVIPDERYSCFLETREEHAFFDGWLTEFTDSDAASLICPRPLLIQTGKKDGIAHWPQVIEEFEVSRTHYEKLGIAERIEMDLHEGGHECRIESGLKFLYAVVDAGDTTGWCDLRERDEGQVILRHGSHKNEHDLENKMNLNANTLKWTPTVAIWCYGPIRSFQNEHIC